MNKFNLLFVIFSKASVRLATFLFLFGAMFLGATNLKANDSLSFNGQLWTDYTINPSGTTTNGFSVGRGLLGASYRLDDMWSFQVAVEAKTSASALFIGSVINRNLWQGAYIEFGRFNNFYFRHHGQRIGTRWLEKSQTQRANYIAVRDTGLVVGHHMMDDQLQFHAHVRNGLLDNAIGSDLDNSLTYAGDVSWMTEQWGALAVVGLDSSDNAEYTTSYLVVATAVTWTLDDIFKSWFEFSMRKPTEGDTHSIYGATFDITPLQPLTFYFNVGYASEAARSDLGGKLHVDFGPTYEITKNLKTALLVKHTQEPNIANVIYSDQLSYRWQWQALF